MATFNEIDIARKLLRVTVQSNNQLIDTLSAAMGARQDYLNLTAPEQTAVQQALLDAFGLDFTELASLSADLAAIDAEVINRGMAKKPSI